MDFETWTDIITEEFHFYRTALWIITKDSLSTYRQRAFVNETTMSMELENCVSEGIKFILRTPFEPTQPKHFVWDGQGWTYKISPDYELHYMNKEMGPENRIQIHNIRLTNGGNRKIIQDYDWKCEGCNCYNDMLVTGWCRGKIEGVERKSYGS